MRFLARLFALIALIAVGVPLVGTLSACQNTSGRIAIAAGAATAEVVADTSENLHVRAGAAAAAAGLREYNQ